MIVLTALVALASGLQPPLPASYSTEKQWPWISARVEGSASQEQEAQLAVYPGSVVHLECVFPRRLGSPEWTWTSPLATYLTGWSAAPEERSSKYKLSIYYAKPEDSGLFTCSVPKGLTSSINLLVTAVHCKAEEAEPRQPAACQLEGTRLGQRARYSCPTGYTLDRPDQRICRLNGKWSGEAPNCRQVVCPELAPRDPRLVVSEHNATLGASVSLSCPWGYKLAGPSSIHCLSTSQWSEVLPSCQEIRCRSPSDPKNGRLLEREEQSEYKVGAVARFSCQARHRLQGEQSLVCLHSGLWSNSPPQCVPYCEYPGEPSNGRLVPLKFSYEPGDRLKVTCHPGFVSRLDASSVCLPDGSWSQPLPHCTNYTQV